MNMDKERRSKHDTDYRTAHATDIAVKTDVKYVTKTPEVVVKYTVKTKKQEEQCHTDQLTGDVLVVELGPHLNELIEYSLSLSLSHNKQNKNTKIVLP